MADELSDFVYPHLGFAEMQCLAQAYKAEGPSAIRGGSMTVVHVSDTLKGAHGDLARPCGACARTLRGLVIGVNDD